MPYARKTLTQLRAEVLGFINSARITDQNGSVLVQLLQKAILRYIAYAQAGVGFEHYSELDYIALQAVPWTATDEFLEGWAGLKGVVREPATATVGTTSYSANTGSGPIPAGTLVTRQSDGAQYLTTAEGDLGGGANSITVTMQAVTPGAAANFDAGTVFLLGTSIPGVQSQSVASAQTTAGTDKETDDNLRTRMLAAYASPPQGGSMRDYVAWAESVPGVTRAWVQPLGLGAGSVVVYFMLDDAEAAHGGFPQGTNGVATAETRLPAATGDQLTLANVLYVDAPVPSLVWVTAPAAQSVNFTIDDLGTNNTTAMQAQINAALDDMFLRLGNVGGTLQPETGGGWPAIEPNDWYEALAAISGLTSFSIAAPTDAQAPNTGALLTRGTMTFNA